MVGKIIHPKKHQRDQNSIAIIIEHHSANKVKKNRLWRTNSGCNTHKCCPITVTAENLFQLFSVDCSGIVITCLDLECKQCSLELDIMYYSAMTNCLNYPAYIPFLHSFVVGVSYVSNIRHIISLSYPGPLVAKTAVFNNFGAWLMNTSAAS